MPKVFPIQATKFPIQSAAEFGHLERPLIDDAAYPTGKAAGAEAHALIQKKMGVVQSIRDVLYADFVPQTDYLLIVGDPILIGLAMSIARDVALDQECEQLKVLRYDKALGRYLDIGVEL